MGESVMLATPKYQERERVIPGKPWVSWGLWDSFAQSWVIGEDHGNKGDAILSAAAHNHAYARAMVDHD
jgi:hypothetical protein